MKVNEIRKSFTHYFSERGHDHLPSSRLIPENDPTLLFTNAGMNQFKNVFLGLEKRENPQVVTIQKCVRAGGKHNDLEKVGYTARHHTFFEMLGNFSFGDYFKEKAIHYAWDFLTSYLGLPKDRLWVTVFDTDDEAFDLWHQQEGLPRDHIRRMGEKDNFWRMGEVGPCGPCSEIYYDLGDQFTGPNDILGGDGDRYMEIWNLVFMQFVEDLEGNQKPLPNPSIDTGAGLERLASVLQGKTSNYHIDLFQKMISSACELTQSDFDPKAREGSSQHKTNVALKVLADHARASSFLIADGVFPSNEGRGYVLRRIIRRAVRYGRQLMEKERVLPHVVRSVLAEMSPAYGELNTQKDLIISTVVDEEQRFLKTLDQGTHLLQQALNKLPQRGTLDGETVFKLYDTYGFPVDLTRLMAQERGVSVDEVGFSRHMQKAREKAKSSWKTKSIPSDRAHIIEVGQRTLRDSGPTKFVGYTQMSHSGTLLLLSNGIQRIDSIQAEESGLAVFDSSSFYAEAGGQVGDSGNLLFAGGMAQVMDCIQQKGIFFHQIKVVEGAIQTGMEVQLQVTESHRRNTASNHSATHLVHAALREVLGKHVVQSGSLVDGERLRFDFTHRQPLTRHEIQQIEYLVNTEISKAIDVSTHIMTPDEARLAGALALFGEKYGDKVRVVQMGDFSMEFCGGTHVPNTAMIRIFKIVSEGGISAGVRRIEALTGEKAVEYLLKHTEQSLEIREHLGIREKWSRFMESGNTLMEWAHESQNEMKTLHKTIKKLKNQAIDVTPFLDKAHPFNCGGVEGRLVLADLDVDDRQVLRDISDQLRDKLGPGVLVVVGRGAKSHPIIVNVSQDLTKSIHAGKLLKEMMTQVGGKGGGRPDSAQGAVPDRTQLTQVFKAAEDRLGITRIKATGG